MSSGETSARLDVEQFGRLLSEDLDQSLGELLPITGFDQNRVWFDPIALAGNNRIQCTDIYYRRRLLLSYFHMIFGTTPKKAPPQTVINVGCLKNGLESKSPRASGA